MPVADNLLQSREELKMEVAVSSALLGSSSVGDIINAASATVLVIEHHSEHHHDNAVALEC